MKLSHPEGEVLLYVNEHHRLPAEPRLALDVVRLRSIGLLESDPSGHTAFLSISGRVELKAYMTHVDKLRAEARAMVPSRFDRVEVV